MMMRQSVENSDTANHSAFIVPEQIRQLEQTFQPGILQRLDHPLLREKGVRVWVKRTDLLDSAISGNKWYKLRFNLIQALCDRAEGVVSFGGAWSNHLHALAKACQALNLPLTAVIRGEAETLKPSAMLQDADSWGMQCHYVTRLEYRKREEPQWLAALMAQFPGYVCIPEGGSSVLAFPGVMQLGQEIEADCRMLDIEPDQLWCAMGTGGTLAGLLAARSGRYRVMGVPVLKGGDFLYQEVMQKLARAGYIEGHESALPCFNLLTDAHAGGYGKVPDDLLHWIKVFEIDTGIPLDPVYTGKLFYRFFQAVEQNDIEPGQRIILLHSGGLQGRRGYGLGYTG